MPAHVQRTRIGNEVIRQVVFEGQVVDTRVIALPPDEDPVVEAQFDDFLLEGDEWKAFDAARAAGGQHLLGPQKGREEFNRHVEAKNAHDRAKEQVDWKRNNRNLAQRQAKRAGVWPGNDKFVQAREAELDKAIADRDATAKEVKATVAAHPEAGQFTQTGRVGTNAPSYFHTTPSGPVYSSPSGDQVTIAHQTALRLRDASIPESTTVSYRGADGKSASWSFSSRDSANAHASKMFGISRY